MQKSSSRWRTRNANSITGGTITTIMVRTVRWPIERRTHLLNSLGREEQRAPPSRPYLPLADSQLKGPLRRLTPPLTWAPTSWFTIHQE